MNNGIIVYGSCYGTTKKYAEELSKKTGIEAKPYEDIRDINSFDTIIYMGGLYAGGVCGMKKTMKKLGSISDKRVFIVTVGLADPMNTENTEHIKDRIRTQLSKEVFEKAYIYHLRGGIDYSILGFKHKTMMSMLYKKIKSMPEEEKNAEIQAMIETYDKQVDFVDFSSLEPIIQEVIM